MKTQVLLLAVAVILCSSCKKTTLPGSDDYYIKFKENGVQKEYKWAVAAQVDENGNLGQSGMALSGVLDPSGNETMALWFSDFTTNKIKLNFPYKTKFIPPSDPEIMMGFEMSGNAEYFASETDPTVTTPNVITVTELTDKYVKGVFSGELVEDINGTDLSVKRVITGGEFRAQRIDVSGNPGGIGKGDGYFEFNIENKKFRVDEKVASGNEVTAKTTLNSGVHTLMLSSSTAQLPVQINTLTIADSQPITGTGEFIMSEADPSWVFSVTTFMTIGASSANTFTYDKTDESEITVNITRNDKVKGGKIEGTFSITKMEKLNGSMVSVAKNLDLTGGKFRATIE